ncbi:hypothetical protein OAO01_04740 [Oligoflexia bacterium]|nr:hypothetical protein [Oligoflexia bacterium]
MPISTVAPISSQQYIPQNQEGELQQAPASKPNRRWEYTLIPQTSTWEGKPVCADEFDENENCCISKKDIEVVLARADEYDLKDHPGVKVLKGRPCISAIDLRDLDDELRYMNYLKSEERESPPIPGAPEFIDISKATHYIPDRRIFRYCDDLLHNTLSYSYGKLKSIPQKAKLGENFRAVVEYCSDVIIGSVRGRVQIFDVLTNNFREED